MISFQFCTDTREQLKYLVSGIGSGPTGVGGVVEALRDDDALKDYIFITRYSWSPLRSMLTRGNLLATVYELLRRSFDPIIFHVRLSQIKDSQVLLIHPQTIGFKNTLKLIDRNNAALYVMDNSFFCIRSYNNHPITKKECLECVGTISPAKDCNPFPIRMGQSKNVEYLNMLARRSHQVLFLAQNKLQAALLKLHFGENIQLSIVGLNIGNFAFANDVDLLISKKYDVVYHGAASIAKGLLYFVEVALRLPEFVFFVPDSRETVESVCELKLPENVECIPMTWETGLKEVVILARFVMNPSLWSAPIEGALLKSSTHNSNVATVETVYGFANEIDTIVNHLRLDADPAIGSQQLKRILNQPLDL